MLGLIFKKNTLLVLGVLGIFAYPMFRDGELSVGKIAGWIAGDQTETQPSYDPHLNPYDPNSTFRPATIGNASSSSLPGANGFSQVGFPPVSSIPKENQNTIADQIGGFLGTIFETQTVDASGQTIPQPNQNPVTQTNSDKSGNVQGQLAGYRPPSVEIDSMPLVDVREIIRFDVSPFWVQQRWPRVSAAPVSEEGFQGLRVPLTSGPGPIDMSGALTYYFDDKQVVQRIQFQGSTNQPVMLQNLCREYFNFQEIPDMPGVMAPVHDSQPCGLLKLSLPVVIDRSRPVSQSQVALEINSTKGPYKLSQMMRFIAVQR